MIKAPDYQAARMLLGGERCAQIAQWATLTYALLGAKVTGKEELHLWPRRAVYLYAGYEWSIDRTVSRWASRKAMDWYSHALEDAQKGHPQGLHNKTVTDLVILAKSLEVVLNLAVFARRREYYETGLDVFEAEAAAIIAAWPLHASACTAAEK